MTSQFFKELGSMTLHEANQDAVDEIAPRAPLKNYTYNILQYAEHIQERRNWLDEDDREALQRIANEIEELSDTVQERVETND